MQKGIGNLREMNLRRRGSLNFFVSRGRSAAVGLPDRPPKFAFLLQKVGTYFPDK